MVQIGFSAQRAFFLPPLAVFWNKTVLGLWPVQELALRHKAGRTGQWAKATAVMSGVFIVFVFNISGNDPSIMRHLT